MNRQPKSLLTRFLPDWKSRGYTKHQATFAIHYILTGRDSKSAYKQTFKAFDSPLTPGTEDYYKMVMYTNDPKVRDATSVVAGAFFGAQKDEIKQWLVEILLSQATFDPSDIINSYGGFHTELENLPLALRRCVAGIEQKQHGTTIKLVDRQAAIKTLAEYCGLLSPIKNEFTIKLSKQEEEAMASAFSEAMEQI